MVLAILCPHELFIFRFLYSKVRDQIEQERGNLFWLVVLTA